jgi:hypothetical protein
VRGERFRISTLLFKKEKNKKIHKDKYQTSVLTTGNDVPHVVVLEVNTCAEQNEIQSIKINKSAKFTNDMK